MNTILIFLKENIIETEGLKISKDANKYFGIDTNRVKTGKLFFLDLPLDNKELNYFAINGLQDVIINDIQINSIKANPLFKSFILVGKLSGVTDDEGLSAQKTLCDLLEKDYDVHQQHIYTTNLYLFENKLNEDDLKTIAEGLLGNKLINYFQYGYSLDRITNPRSSSIKSSDEVNILNLNVSDDELIRLSKEMVLSLDLIEMKALQGYYNSSDIKKKRLLNGISENPTDCEIEIFAQTWSEHCKHKEFKALIEYKDCESGIVTIIDSLFDTFIKSSTNIIKHNLSLSGQDWLVKVFSDNAGVVKIDDNNLFVWKVETHNSPSAIDPYGGAITGILGNNRDPLGTGIGGAKLLFNTNVLCFGNPFYKGKLLTGQLHPNRIMQGVIKGIEDGGNKSGIPTINGSIIFDDRYSGKPLVYCGTGAVMDSSYLGRDSWKKEVHDGDIIVMAGGRVGKDGIHGATFSSTEINELSPSSAVQIGSPITQKLLSDFMELACKKGLIKCSTDNGAGGLSSSIGELATISGGAVVYLDNIPLKYSGLKPWEIFLSESQERMTFVVEKDKLAILFQMAREMDVELSDIGYFSSDGFLKVHCNNKLIACLELSFLHDGVPKKHLQAEWIKPNISEPKLPKIDNYNEIVLKLLGSLNICSRESVIRVYDHEVKGKTVIKPLMGKQLCTPQDAGVIRIDHNTYQGVAVSNGIIPRYGDIDPYQMSAGAFDEAIRQIISIGGHLPEDSRYPNNFWSVNDNFCVPDSVFNPDKNPDGKLKLAKLVKMCQALYDMSTYYCIPMTSGKDSMKNDFVSDGVKISVPPTVLYSMVCKIEDIRNCVTSDYKSSDDLIYLLGTTYDELGGSEFYKLFNELGSNVPQVRKEQAKELYIKLSSAIDNKLIESCHDLSDGGLIISVLESAFGTNYGIDISLDTIGNYHPDISMFSESHSRFIVTIKNENKSIFESIFKDTCHQLGIVTKEQKAVIKWNNKVIVNLDFKDIEESWKKGLIL